ncbi:hypothetical protein R3P38DRAFT_3260375 [Favolaschia claudopus]|uniref:Uncharacterized protein n=1 Tax=Favolaschia claudopus TaxID=2862362 RepID=A0AAW0CTQ9_9AGAR
MAYDSTSAPSLLLSDILHPMSPPQEPRPASPAEEVLQEQDIAQMRATALRMDISTADPTQSTHRERELLEMVLRLTNPKLPSLDRSQLMRQAATISDLVEQREYLRERVEEERFRWESEKVTWERTAEVLLWRRDRELNGPHDSELERMCSNLEFDNNALRVKLHKLQGRINALEADLCKLKPHILMQPFVPRAVPVTADNLILDSPREQEIHNLTENVSPLPSADTLLAHSFSDNLDLTTVDRHPTEPEAQPNLRPPSLHSLAQASSYFASLPYPSLQNVHDAITRKQKFAAQLRKALHANKKSAAKNNSNDNAFSASALPAPPPSARTIRTIAASASKRPARLSTKSLTYRTVAPPQLPISDARAEHLLLAARRLGRERAGVVAGVISAEHERKPERERVERERERGERERRRQQVGGWDIIGSGLRLSMRLCREGTDVMGKGRTARLGSFLVAPQDGVGAEASGANTSSGTGMITRRRGRLAAKRDYNHGPEASARPAKRRRMSMSCVSASTRSPSDGRSALVDQEAVVSGSRGKGKRKEKEKEKETAADMSAIAIALPVDDPIVQPVKRKRGRPRKDGEKLSAAALSPAVISPIPFPVAGPSTLVNVDALQQPEVSRSEDEPRIARRESGLTQDRGEPEQSVEAADSQAVADSSMHDVETIAQVELELEPVQLQGDGVAPHTLTVELAPAVLDPFHGTYARYEVSPRPIEQGPSASLRILRVSEVLGQRVLAEPETASELGQFTEDFSHDVVGTTDSESEPRLVPTLEDVILDAVDADADGEDDPDMNIAIGRGINAIISAIAAVFMTIVGVITTVIVTIFEVILSILCCRCFGSGRRTGTYSRRRRGGRSLAAGGGTGPGAGTGSVGM